MNEVVSQPSGSSGRDVLKMPILLVNRFFSPVCVSSLKRGLVLMYTGAAQAVDDGGQVHGFNEWLQLPVRQADDRVPIVGGEFRVPRVLQLPRYEKPPIFSVRLTRRNLLLRDQHQCQYCGRQPLLRDLNVDHVLPRSRGGRDTWENLVISCRWCNLKKGRRTPLEAGMTLRAEPHKPRWTMATQILMTRPLFAEWKPFLGIG